MNYQDIYEQMETELIAEKTRNQQLINSQMSMFNPPNEDNLIRWQLELKEDLDKIYHLLKGDVLIEDENGNMIYKPTEDDNLKPFNEFGVQIILKTMSFYLNRNTLLSNYDEKTIKYKVLDFGFEIGDLILCRYKDMMLTTSFEKEFYKEYGQECYKTPNNIYTIKIIKEGQEYYVPLSKDVFVKINSNIAEHLQNKVELYPMIVQELVDTVHSAYLRALNNGERESLRTARTIHQTETIGGNPMMNSMMPQRRFSILKPSTWI